MYRKLVLLLIIFLSQIVVAQEAVKIDVGNTAFSKSYSYTLMDEIKLIKDSHQDKLLVETSKVDYSGGKFKNFFDYDKKSEMFDIGVLQTTQSSIRYIVGDFSASFYSSRKKGRESSNKSILHLDYKLAPGIFPYIETQLIDRNSGNDFLNIRYLPDNKKRSTLFLIGTKIEF